MPYTPADLAALDALIASGTLTVRFSDGRQVTYQSLEALLRARALISAELNALSAAPANRSAWADITR